MHYRLPIVGAVAIVVLAITVPPALAVPTTQHASTVGDESTGTPAIQQCNYQQLYDESVDSLALIRTEGGLGSGFVYNVTDDGAALVVTNQHVVADVDEVRVEFSRRDSASGTVLGTDELSDLAVIRVTEPPAYAEALPLSEDRPDPGQAVAALGSPFGLESTITSGIVSGVNRSVPTQAGYALPNTIQTDAPINPGNSGGPLVQCPNGTVIGVNRAGGGEDIGFAIPASILERVVPNLVANGTHGHAFLGVGAVELTPSIAQANDVNTTDGLLVVRTIDGTPADDAFQESDRIAALDGERAPVGGDVIVSIENRSIETTGDLARFLALEASPGETVEVTVIRDGQRETVDVRLVERPGPEDV